MQRPWRSAANSFVTLAHPVHFLTQPGTTAKLWHYSGLKENVYQSEWYYWEVGLVELGVALLEKNVTVAVGFKVSTMLKLHTV